MDDDQIRNELMHELEEAEWDLSPSGIEHVARRMERYFGSLEEAKGFVEEHASYLQKAIEDFYES